MDVGSGCVPSEQEMMMKKVNWRVLVLLGLGFFVVACGGGILALFSGVFDPEDYVTTARSRVQTGDEREQALSELADAWFHSVCPMSSGAVDDLFFYGPKDRTNVTVVVVTSKPSGGHLAVTFVGHMDSDQLPRNHEENKSWHCEPSLLSAFE
jgi:hypothetical protein